MLAMSIEPSKLHLSQNEIHTGAPLKSHLVQYARKCTNFDRFVIGDCNRVDSRFITFQYHVRTNLAVQFVSKSTHRSSQFCARNISRHFHAAASMMRSSSRCNRILPGFSSASIKWQNTASRTIVSISSHESPCVAIKPDGKRQSAVKPPSSAGRTRKVNSKSFMP